MCQPLLITWDPQDSAGEPLAQFIYARLPRVIYLSISRTFLFGQFSDATSYPYPINPFFSLLCRALSPVIALLLLPSSPGVI